MSIRYPGTIPTNADASYGRSNGQLGLHLPSLAGSGTNYAAAARTLYYRLVPSRPMSIVGASYTTIVAAASNDTIEIGFMSAAGARIVTSGAVAGKLNPAAGVQTVSLTATLLLPGLVYYFALATTAPGGTASQLCARGQSGAACWDIAGAAIPAVECANENAVTAIPATMGTLSAQVAAYPHIFLRET